MLKAPAKLTLKSELDDGPGRVRVGVVVFDEDVTTEDALAGLRLPGQVAYISRMPLPLDHSAAGLRRAAADLAAAAARLAPSARLDAVAYSCTTGAIELGYGRVAAAFGQSRPGAPVATPMSGAVKALTALGVRRLALLTPYEDWLNALVLEDLAANGLEVVSIGALSVASEVDFARVSLGSLRAAAHAVMIDDAQALFISCTALRGADLIAELEWRFGKPVITSTQAMWWEALRLAGDQTPNPHAGRLFTR